MQLYELSGCGYHTPLSPSEIAKLFQAARIHRDTRCRAIDGPAWRTIDELFPLLKYDNSGGSADSSDQAGRPSFTSRHKVVAVAVGTIAAAIAFALGALYASSSRPAKTPVLQRRTSADTTTLPLSAASNSSSGFSSQALPSSTARNSVTTQALAAPTSEIGSDRRVAEERRTALVEDQRRREQEQRNQAMNAQRFREKNARDAAQSQRDTGIDTIVPLDAYYPINVGGSSVTVKVHDHDVTSFGIWINGRHYPQLKKNKGISQSRTDETLVYDSGSAQLYYVWELSGKLNHCRMRVRQR